MKAIRLPVHTVAAALLTGVAAASSPGCTGAAQVPAPAAAEVPQAPTPAPPPPGRLVFLADTDPQSAVVAMRPDGQERTELLRGTGLFPSGVAPGGDLLTVIAVEEEGEVHLERLQVFPLTDTGVGAVLYTSPPAAQVRNPSWGPGGRFLVFEASFDSFRDIYRVDFPGAGAPPSALRRLTNNPEGNFEPQVRPDGQAIAFASSRDGNAEIYTMTADGADQTRLTAFHLDDWGPQWRPDGQALVFLSNREMVDRIFLMRPDGGEQRRLTGDPTPPPAPDGRLGDEPHETDPVFAPDGASLAFCVRTPSRGASLRVADLATGAVQQLTDGKESDRNPTWSPDGAHLVFVSTRDGGDLELYRIGRAGDGLLRLTERDGADWLPRWAAAPPTAK